MTIVTLTTDYGTQDYYAGSLKGILLSRSPGIQLIDITHNVKSYDIVQAAFLVKNAYTNFPTGTIHIVSVHVHSGPAGWLLGVEHDGQIFLGPDNGLFTLMFGTSVDFFKIPFQSDFPGAHRTAIADVVCALAEGKALRDIGEPSDDFVERIHFQPIVTHDQIRASVIHIDHYGNVIFNLTKSQFEKLCDSRNFELYYRRYDPIREIHQRYSDVGLGEVLALFNDTGYLELAVNTGKADQLLGLKIDDMIQIRFY